ncbi:MAG: alpha/beta hydrolase [Anaerolineaceae bacterium]
MEKPAVLEGISNRMVETTRLTQNVYFSGSDTAVPVVFLHGNCSAALYWEETMLNLPKGYRGIAPDFRGYGWTEDLIADATRGMKDWSDDIIALLEALKLPSAHFVGWSMGAGVLYRLITDYPQRVMSATLICPVSPYGFGGTKGPDGQPCWEDFAGSGGGVVNQDFVRLIKAGDRSTANPNSPRNVINAYYFKPPFKAAREEDFLTALLAEKIGDDRYPGDFALSPHWPGVGPGKFGPVNSWSPKYLMTDAEELIGVHPKPPILWVRGDSDLIVSDNSFFDLGTLGALGYIPGWPGNEIYPPQPMVTQTRTVLEKYASQGGIVHEYVIKDAGHSVYIEKPKEFNTLFHAFLKDHS